MPSWNFITDEIKIQFWLLSVYVSWLSELLKSSEGIYILQTSKYVCPRINTHILTRNVVLVGARCYIPVGQQFWSYCGVDGSDTCEHEEHHEVYVWSEVWHKLYDWNLVVLVAEWKGECHPHWRAEDECKEQEHCPPCCPVEVTLPKFLFNKQSTFQKYYRNFSYEWFECWKKHHHWKQVVCKKHYFLRFNQ